MFKRIDYDQYLYGYYAQPGNGFCVEYIRTDGPGYWGVYVMRDGHMLMLDEMYARFGQDIGDRYASAIRAPYNYARKVAHDIVSKLKGAAS